MLGCVLGRVIALVLGLGDLGITDEGGLKEYAQFTANLIRETVEKFKSKEEGICILCLGPMANMALAVMKDHNLAQKV